MNEQRQEIPNGPFPQISDEQQPLIENNQRPNRIPEQILNAQQQQQNRPQVPERQRQQIQDEQHQQILDRHQPLILNEQIQDEQEPQIPDEVRQMPDAQQQQMLREIFRQELHQFQRYPKNNNTTLLSIFIPAIVIVVIAFLLRPQMDFVPRREFETYKTDNRNGLVALRENSQNSLKEHEAKMIKFGKHWEEILASMMKSNATARELPDNSIQNLIDATRKAQAEVSKLRNEVSDLQGKNNKLQKSLDNLEARFRKLESKSEPKQAQAFTAITVFLLILAILF